MAGRAMKSFFLDLRERVRTFGAAEGGNIAVIFAITLLPVMTGVGAAIDYSRANATKPAARLALSSPVPAAGTI